jgi:hypothetical protein
MYVLVSMVARILYAYFKLVVYKLVILFLNAYCMVIYYFIVIYVGNLEGNILITTYVGNLDANLRSIIIAYM